MASSALNRFPAEIVRTILADVPNADFPAARLLGKNFANIATPRLFSSIPLWISLKSLENLTNIASHAQLRLYVKEIVFSPLRVIEHEDESEYFSGIEEALEYEPDPANAVALRIGEHMASYHGYIGAQEYLAKEERDVKIMCRAFRQFPALNTATICYNDRVSGWSYTGLKETSTTFDILRAKDLTSNTGAHTLPTFAKGLAAAGVKIAKFNIGLPPDVTDSKQKGLSFSTNVASIRPSWVSNPTVITAKALGEAFRVIDKFSDSSTWLVSELRVLNIYKMKEETFISLDDIANAITKIISMAPQLETVSMESLSPQINPDFIDPCYLFDVPRSPLHPLRNLALQNLIVEPYKMEDFLEIYAGSLITVMFAGMVCENDTWSTVLENLRAFTFSNLRQFRLDRCFNYHIDAGYLEDTDATDYLLHKTDQNPQSDP